jgi:hypothetical protein
VRSLEGHAMKSDHGHQRGEEGAVAVIVAILFATVFIAAAAIAIDLGSMWSSQRSLVTDTDAAALAAARTLSEMRQSECLAQRSQAQAGTGVVYTEVQSVLHANTPSDELISVEIECRRRTGKVTVVANQPAIGVFAGAMGNPEPSVGGRSSAEWSNPGYDPLPLAVCETIFDGVDAPPTQHDIVIPYKGAGGEDSDCPDWLGVDTDSDAYAPGNWGWLGFDELFDGLTFLGGLVCDEEETGYWCDGAEGNDPSNSDKLFQNLRDDGDVFEFVLFDYTRNPHNPDQTATGTNADFRLTGVGEARLLKCLNSQGKETNCQGNPRSLVIDLYNITWLEGKTVEARRADISLCGERLSDRCA